MPELTQTEKQIAHRIAADATESGRKFADSETGIASCMHDERLRELDEDSRKNVVRHACRLQEFWRDSGVKKPTAQTFLDDLCEASKQELGII